MQYLNIKKDNINKCISTLTLNQLVSCMMFQNGRTHFKSLVANAVKS